MSKFSSVLNKRWRTSKKGAPFALKLSASVTDTDIEVRQELAAGDRPPVLSNHRSWWRGAIASNNLTLDRGGTSTSRRTISRTSELVQKASRHEHLPTLIRRFGTR
ncbi:hypothetical protein [Leptolyngbya sp. FACHB-541]|uniref:hypothetical protein n=1 Tax=Leptolyngbya sp. FACHB-541 TaxID=2692810 RepID=UPI0016871CB6|nr:hypothetical protein [Leptolyngbya sp. FACHB-541]